jgi:hypothetical protein
MVFPPGPVTMPTVVGRGGSFMALIRKPTIPAPGLGPVPTHGIRLNRTFLKGW